MARPALAGGRLRLVDADPLSFALKTPWPDGTRHLLLSPIELLEKLAALIPPPRSHLLRYHGVLAPRGRARERIVPAQPVAEPSAENGDASAAACSHRLRWATPLARVFSLAPGPPEGQAAETARVSGREDYPFAIELEVWDYECDLQGVVNNALDPG